MVVSNTDTVIVNSVAIPEVFRGLLPPCAGATVAYYILSVPGATSYNWTLPTGWSGSSTDTSIAVTVGTTGGTITVAASSAVTGCTSGVRTRGVIVSQPLAMPAAITGDTSVCSNSSQVYSISAITGAASYTWTLPTGWSGTSTGTSITTIAGTNSGTISVTANNTFGASVPQTLTVMVQPVYNTSYNAATCQGVPYSFAGSSYTASGSYPHTFTSQFGCDSIVTLNLTVTQLFSDTITASICSGQAYSLGGGVLPYVRHLYLSLQQCSRLRFCSYRTAHS